MDTRVLPARRAANPADSHLGHLNHSQPGRRADTMEGKAYLTDEPAYKALQQFYSSNGAKLNILQMFKEDPERFKKYR